MNTSNPPSDAIDKVGALSQPDEREAEAQVAPWELIDTGRYQPRRIRGSCRGRVLG